MAVTKYSVLILIYNYRTANVQLTQNFDLVSVTIDVGRICVVEITGIIQSVIH
jgi:hypothetical protein